MLLDQFCSDCSVTILKFSSAFFQHIVEGYCDDWLLLVFYYFRVIFSILMSFQVKCLYIIESEMYLLNEKTLHKNVTRCVCLKDHLPKI